MTTGLAAAVLPRFECKYLIDPVIASEIRAFMRPFVEPDPFAAARADRGYRYTICSLYLDSPDLRLFNQTVAGEKHRFKLRIRSYGDDPAQPVFLEVKKRENAVMRKVRAAVPRTRARSLLSGNTEEALQGLSDALGEAVNEFAYHAQSILARAVIRVRYTREAWVPTTHEPLRITFDTELMHALTLDDNLSCTEGDWQSTPVGATIFEIKFTERFPFWVHDLIAMFGLTQRSVPKYVMCIDEAVTRGNATELAVAGFTLPPCNFERRRALWADALLRTVRQEY